MQKMGKAIFGALISIFVIVLLTSASTAVPYVESNSQSENLEIRQREHLRDKIKSLFSRIEDKNSMVSENPGNLTLLQLLRIIFAFLLIIPSWILMVLGAIPMLLYEIVIMVLSIGIGIIFTLLFIPVLLYLFIPIIFIACSEVISSNGEIGFIEAIRNLFNPDTLFFQNFLMFCLRNFRSDAY